MTRRRRLVELVSRVASASDFLWALETLRRKRGDFRVHILEYHGVEDGAEREGVVSTERFRKHLAWLAKRYRAVTVEQAARRLQEGPLKEDLLVITFDDGYRDNHRCAWPALREADLPATVYLTTGFLDGQPLWFDTARRTTEALESQGQTLPESIAAQVRTALGEVPPLPQLVNRLKYAPADARLRITEALAALPIERPRPPAVPLSWDEARELQAAGIELGAHTVTHPILSRLPADEQHHELEASRRRIADETGVEPTTFAMPNGSQRDYDQHTLTALRNLGFLAACTTVRGSNRHGQDLHQLRRIGVGSDSLPVLEARLAGLFGNWLRKLLGRGKA